MRVVYFNRQLGSFDGGASHASGMLAGLRRSLGEDAVVVANAPRSVKYSHRSYWLKRRLGALMDIPRIVRRDYISRAEVKDVVRRIRDADFNADVLLARAELYDTTPRRVADELGCKLVLEVNTPFEFELCDVQHRSFRPLVRAGERHLLRTADGIYAVSETLKSMLMESHNVPSEKIAVVPNGYSRDLYSDLASRPDIRSAVRARLDVEDAFVVTFIGSLQDWHGTERLIQIAEELKNRPPDGSPRVALWVVGDGPQRDQIKRYADESEVMHWHGAVPAQDMKDLLYASDLGVMPYDELTRFYFSPLKMFDMIGAGLPFIGLGSGQIREVALRSLSEEFLMQSTRPETYALRIRELASKSTQLEHMADKVMAARATMSWEVRAESLVAFFRNVGR